MLCNYEQNFLNLNATYPYGIDVANKLREPLDEASRNPILIQK